MYKKRKISLIIALIIAFLSGCDGRKGPPVSLYDVLEQVEAPQPEVEIETVGVYVDVTSSMKGFLNNSYGGDSDSFTLYSLCLNTMGRQISSRYDQVTFYRVDTPLWKVVVEEDVLELARDVSYYKKSENFPDKKYEKVKEGDGYNSLCLTAALEEGTNQDLSILITDLYENSFDNNTNVNAFISQIQKLTELDDGKVFGLIGVRSIFSGYIYDVGVDGSSVPYGLDGPAYRPFYILLRGYPEHVQSFCEEMERRLSRLGARKGQDYEVSVFYEDQFWGLDYTAWAGCASQLSPKKESIWLDDQRSVIAGDTELPIYGYQIGDGTYGSPMYFAYSVDPARQEEFHALAEEIGVAQNVDFLPEGEKELCALPCPARDLKMFRWKEEGAFEEIKEGAFEICGLYYDQDGETLYAGLRVADRQLTEGVWRLEWKNVLEPADLSLNPWWEDWCSPEGKNVDYSKTERLLDYMTPILGKISGMEQCVLHGVVYLSIN